MNTPTFLDIPATPEPAPPHNAPLHNEPEDELSLANYAQRAYLEYALSVVKGRALPDVCDGLKPVQRRILYAMQRMGLSYGGPNGNIPAKPVKSARVVGDVLGRFHPHGDQSAYDALVRLAQDFQQRYPLIDGQGNFGSRDGDGAAAMRYTEARLAKITHLLLDEIDHGTVEFVPNYDGSTHEPRQLPARLPLMLLNGTSGIAVGLATEIPSHNLREVADACVALIKNPHLSHEQLLAIIPGPDYPGGGHIISSASDIEDAYRSGRGSLKVRARWQIEELARHQWQMVVTELPPGVSAQKVLQEIEDLTNPKIKTGKKTLTQEQTQLKAALLALLDTVRDESSKDAAVRLVIEPKSSKITPQELITALLAHTSLEVSTPINLTMVGLDGKPTQKSLRHIFLEWIAFRHTTLTQRTQHRLDKVTQRIHLLQGRALVLLHMAQVLAIISASDDPKQALMAQFNLSLQQVEDVLEMRLRQLARLESIKIEHEIQELEQERITLEDVLADPVSLRRLMVREIQADAKQFADARRTVIQAEKKAVVELKVVDEAVTLIVSTKGWVRVRQGHGLDAGAFAFKAGDELHRSLECRSVDQLIIFGSNGRVYSVAVASVPAGRGDGQPITTLIQLEATTQPLYYFAGPPSAQLLLASSGGYGFCAQVQHMLARNRSGKAFITLGADETLCAPAPVMLSRTSASTSTSTVLEPATHVCCISEQGRALSFEMVHMRLMPKGGRGLQLLALDEGDSLVGVAAYTQGVCGVCIEGVGRAAKERHELLEGRTLHNAAAPRGSKGKVLQLGFKPMRIFHTP